MTLSVFSLDEINSMWQHATVKMHKYILQSYGANTKSTAAYYVKEAEKWQIVQSRLMDEMMRRGIDCL